MRIYYLSCVKLTPPSSYKIIILSWILNYLKQKEELLITHKRSSVDYNSENQFWKMEANFTIFDTSRLISSEHSEELMICWSYIISDTFLKRVPRFKKFNVSTEENLFENHEFW